MGWTDRRQESLWSALERRERAANWLRIPKHRRKQRVRELARQMLQVAIKETGDEAGLVGGVDPDD